MNNYLDEKKPLNLQILESLKPIFSHSKHVRINKEKLEAFALTLDKNKFSKNEKNNFPHKLINEYIQNESDRVDSLGVFNSINFCYWSQKNENKWKYFSTCEQTEKDGAEALLLSLIENYRKDSHFFFGSSLKSLDHKKLEKVIINRNEIPLFQDRLTILNEFGNTLEVKFDNRFSNFVKRNLGYNSSKIIMSILRDFPSFDDSYTYKGKRIWFLKRAQLLISNLSERRSFSHPIRNELTAFADYKIPMVLENLGILEYSSELKGKIINRKLIPKASQMEFEVRAFTIYAIEMIKKKSRIKINSAQIDNLLWAKSQKIEGKYHLTRTTAY